MKKTKLAVERCKTMTNTAKDTGRQMEAWDTLYIGVKDICRFGALRLQIEEITESSLTKQLRELEAEHFLIRHDFHEVPPRVEYSLTELDRSFIEVLDFMKAWGDSNLPK